LGGPTPENYRPDDDSSKLKDPATTLAQVRDVVNAKASAADSMKGVKEETEEDEDLVDEEEVDEDEEVVAEESCDDEEEGPKPKKGKKSPKEDPKKILKKMKMK
jgi:hypothetical protein